MCVVSFIGDHYEEKWQPYLPLLPTAVGADVNYGIKIFPRISRSEFDQLKKEVEEMKKILIKAKIYDEKNNEPNCEMEEKIKFIKQIAKFVGIDLEDILKK